MERILYKLPPSGKSIIGLNAVEWVKKFTTINKKAKLMPIPTQKPCRFKRPLKLNKSWSKLILFLSISPLSTRNTSGQIFKLFYKVLIISQSAFIYNFFIYYVLFTSFSFRKNLYIIHINKNNII